MAERRSPSFLERFGVSRLEQRHKQGGIAARGGDDDVHLLNADERADLFALERRAIAKAGLIGAASAGISAVVEVALIPHEADVFFYWGVLGAVSAVCAVLEILLLSLDALHAAHGQAVIAGVRVDDDVDRDRTFRLLARAALELPNPIDELADVTIDPLKETPKAWLLMAAIAYKAKVSVTNVIIKQLVRRALGRATLRAAVVPFVSVPVTAIWNIAVARRVLRESRVRVLGPPAAYDVVRRLLPDGEVLNDVEVEAALRAVGAAIVRSADLHPNHAALLMALRERLGADTLPEEIDSSPRFQQALAKVSEDRQPLVRTLLRVAVILDGRVPRRERLLLRDAQADDGVSDALEAFTLGLPIPLGAAIRRAIVAPSAFLASSDA